MSKATRTAWAAALAMVGMAAVGTQSQAAIVYMNLSDVHAPIAGLVGCDGTKMVSLGGKDDFSITDGVVPPVVSPNSQFNITSGFSVLSATVTDTNGSGTANAGDRVRATLGAGTFEIVNQGGIVLLSGSFTGANVSTAIGASAITINAGSVNGLDLTPGPAMVGYVDLQAVESFALNVVGIAPGVQVAGPLTPVTSTLWKAAGLQAFGMGPGAAVTSGSLDLTAQGVVPEPASLGLIGLGVVGLAARRRRMA